MAAGDHDRPQASCGRPAKFAAPPACAAGPQQGFVLQFVAQPAVEALVVAVLLRLVRSDDGAQLAPAVVDGRQNPEAAAFGRLVGLEVPA